MKEVNPLWIKLSESLFEIIENQRKELLRCGRRIVPTLTSEDVLQPNDYLELEHNPFFRYEEGVLAGMQTIEMALSALKKDIE